ncbi:3D domain-containing protein [Arhodomonas sp. AD133]|uniref:3D domain-containing protein n=1 Tax=Arhodomonas sp. AD133 TaxID=3415009 RepID=UPI003EC10610
MKPRRVSWPISGFEPTSGAQRPTHPRWRRPRFAGVLIAAAVLAGCATANGHEQAACRQTVTATAYNSTPGQTDDRPNLGAWGDRLEPGMRIIAVSPDLIPKGLDRGTAVRIEGLSGTYRVLDRMPSRWHRKIDIYMGRDVAAARAWGRRRVTIRWPGEC